MCTGTASVKHLTSYLIARSRDFAKEKIALILGGARREDKKLHVEKIAGCVGCELGLIDPVAVVFFSGMDGQATFGQSRVVPSSSARTAWPSLSHG